MWTQYPDWPMSQGSAARETRFVRTVGGSRVHELTAPSARSFDPGAVLTQLVPAATSARAVPATNLLEEILREPGRTGRRVQ